MSYFLLVTCNNYEGFAYNLPSTLRHCITSNLIYIAINENSKIKLESSCVCFLTIFTAFKPQQNCQQTVLLYYHCVTKQFMDA